MLVYRLLCLLVWCGGCLFISDDDVFGFECVSLRSGFRQLCCLGLFVVVSGVHAFVLWRLRIVRFASD